MPPESQPSAVPATAPGACPQGGCQISVWGTVQRGFAARAVLPDGSSREFSSTFELAQWLGAWGWLPEALPRGGPGLR